MDYDRLTLPEIPVQKERPIWYIHPVLRDMGLDERSSSDRLQIGFANLPLQPLASNLLPVFYARSRESVQDSC